MVSGDPRADRSPMPEKPSPRSPIALVTRLDPGDEAAWRAALSAEMPSESIVSFRRMTPGEKSRAEIAIVANPEPAAIRELPNCRWIQSLWAGVERLVDEIGDLSIPIVRMTDPQLAQTMAEASLAWTFYLSRRMPAYARQQRERVWKQLPLRRPQEIQVGILGLGRLGLASARSLQSNGFCVRGWSRRPKKPEGLTALCGDEGLEELLSVSQILICLLPLTGETRGLLDARRLDLLPEGASLINFARGPIVVTQDLLAALDSGALEHAVLDVFDTEPLPAASPLWDHPGVTVLPHISAPTDTRSACAVVAANIAAYRDCGTLPPTVDVAQGY